MQKILKLAALALFSAFAAQAYAQSAPVAVVNGKPIPQERLELRVKMLATQGQQADTPEMRKAVRDDLINIELMSQEAARKNLDKQPETAQQLELTRESVLVGAFIQDYVKSHPVSDEVLSKEYEHLKSTLGNKEYKLSHILVEKESDAKSIAAKLKKGAKFDKLATINTKDVGSKDLGGDLGWIPVGNIPTAFAKPFGDAVMTLSKGQVSAPVQSQFGWHLIKLDDVRDLSLPPFADVKPQIAQRLQQQAIQSLITELRATAKIE
ncbi:MAG: peptidylprolyl isomerase [Pseudomonadota bacterium]